MRSGDRTTLSGDYVDPGSSDANVGFSNIEGFPANRPACELMDAQATLHGRQILPDLNGFYPGETSGAAKSGKGVDGFGGNLGNG